MCYNVIMYYIVLHAYISVQKERKRGFFCGTLVIHVYTCILCRRVRCARCVEDTCGFGLG